MLFKGRRTLWQIFTRKHSEARLVWTRSVGLESFGDNPGRGWTSHPLTIIHPSLQSSIHLGEGSWILLPSCPKAPSPHPMCCRAQACPAHAFPFPSRYHPNLVHSHQWFQTGALHCTPPISQSPPISCSHVRATLHPRATHLSPLRSWQSPHFSQAPLSSYLPCCPLMVESPAQSLHGLTDPVSVGEILIYGTIHPSGSSTRLESHLSGVPRRHRARAGTSKVPNH